MEPAHEDNIINVEGLAIKYMYFLIENQTRWILSVSF